MLKSFQLSGGTEHGISGSALAPFLDAEHPSLETLDVEGLDIDLITDDD